MQIVRNWASGPNPIPLHDLNYELAELIQYHVDDNRKITGATLKMASGQTIEADASTARHIFLGIANHDYPSREFLGEVEPTTEATAQTPATRLRDSIVPAALILAVLILLWEILYR